MLAQGGPLGGAISACAQGRAQPTHQHVCAGELTGMLVWGDHWQNLRRQAALPGCLHRGASLLGCAGDRSGNLIVWDTASGAEAWRLKKKAHDGHVTALAWWDDGDPPMAGCFVSGGQDGCLRVRGTACSTHCLDYTLPRAWAVGLGLGRGRLSWLRTCSVGGSIG